MDDMVKCRKCGKETNKYSPSCEHCFTPLERDIPQPQGEPARSIGAEGKGLHEALERSSRLKKCPFCAEEIQADAIKCRYCGEYLDKKARAGSKPAGAGEKKKFSLSSFLASLAVVIVLFLIFVGVTQFSNKGVANFRYDKKVNELSAELKKDPAKAEYVKKNITLAKIGTLDEIDAGSSTPTKYIYGTIKNNGDKRIIKLQLTVYYFDKGGKLIAEGSIWPILGNKAKLDSIKPNSSRDFQFLVTSTVPGWSGKIRAKVSDVEFAD